jgi:hypothetical protein
MNPEFKQLGAGDGTRTRDALVRVQHAHQGVAWVMNHAASYTLVAIGLVALLAALHLKAAVR